jgi:hypothetical protein
MDSEKRASDLEKIVADLSVRFMYLEDKLFDARDRIRELEHDSLIALAAYYRTHPEALADMRRIDELLGIEPSGKKQRD